jgi:L-asparagine oxygenase
MLKELRLCEADRLAVRKLLVEIGSDPANLEEDSFLNHAALLAHELPIGIRQALYDFKLRETSAVLLITNTPVLPQDVGPTPRSHWHPGERRVLNLPQIMHGLYASILGEPFGFDTQQGGRIFNDLIPIPGAPSNSSSGEGRIGLHTEDCFTLFSPDYLGLLCLRNEERAITTFSALWPTKLAQAISSALFEQTFVPKRVAAAGSGYSMLFGDPERPYLRYGAIDHSKCTSEMTSALRALSETLEKNQQEITLVQGDCLYLDNLFAVHGRAAYQPQYNSNGRWFCRLVMTRDLRKTRHLRAASDARIMLRDKY